MFEIADDFFDEASITVAIVQGLRAARNAGIKVDKKCIDKAVDYIVKSYDDNGSFLYSLRQKIHRPSFALTAAGLSTLTASGQINEDHKGMIEDCTKVLLTYQSKGKSYHSEYYYYYALFYASQEMYQLEDGKWSDWYISIRDDLLRRQKNSKGAKYAYWKGNVSEIYCTAMSVLILQIPTNYLPIFQK